jgi:hypothetical protein
MFATGSSSAQSCAATEQNADYSVENGSSNTVTLNANIRAVGDLVAFTAWCYQGCTPVSLTLGSQVAARTTVSGTSDSLTGQGFIYYILAAASSGPQTITFTVSGTHSGIQTSYIDFTPTAGCTFSHHVDSPLGSGTGGTVNTPSITPTAGDLLFNFTWISEHINSVNSPWSCPVYSGPGETQSCEFVNTVNAAAYILSAPSGPTANNMTLIHSSDTWQALIASFTLSSGSGGPAPPSNLQAIPQ